HTDQRGRRRRAAPAVDLRRAGVDALSPPDRRAAGCGPGHHRDREQSMKLMRVGAVGAERPVAVGEDEQAWDLTPLTADIDGAFLADGGIAKVRAALEAGDLPAARLDGQRVG